MEEKLKGFEGKRVDINCGTAAIFRGTVKEVGGGLVTILDEDKLMISIAVDKIIAVTECVDPVTRPGFIV